MFIIASIIFLVAGIWRGSIVFYQMYKRPKVQAEIISKYKKSGFPPFKKKEHDFAMIKYIYQEHRFDEEEIDLKSKAEVGDLITCFVDPDNPKDIAQFNPKKDAIPVIIVLSLGIGLMIFHFWAMEMLSE